MNNNLERLIKQGIPFTSPQLKAQVGLLYLAYCINSSKQTQFKKFGITLQQYNILRILRGQFPKPANISLLRDRMVDKMSDVSRLINRLYKLGYVSKQPNEVDKRNADVLITQKALDLVAVIEKEKMDMAPMLDNLTESEINAFNETIDKLLGYV